MQWQLRGDRPIYQQIMEKLTEQIVSGQLNAGDKVPPVRELAAQAGVNPNTMQRALADLEREGLMHSNRTSGRYVTEDRSMIAQIREQIADERISEFLAGMSQLGFTEQEILSLVVCRGLTKNYGSFTALKNLDLNLERGRFIGLLGPNGSGKTTTIKLLNGLLQPTSGMITVDGAQPGCYTHSIVSYLPDRAYLSDWMKVTDVIDFFSDLYRDFDRVKAIEMFKALRISPLDRLKTLSKGTKEKVQLILTMSRRAQLYVLDEPIAGVDPAARDYILNTILANYSEDASVLLSTHLIADIERVLDEVVFLKNGEMVLHESVDTIREEHGKSVDMLFREVFAC